MIYCEFMESRFSRELFGMIFKSLVRIVLKKGLNVPSKVSLMLKQVDKKIAIAINTTSTHLGQKSAIKNM